MGIRTLSNIQDKAFLLFCKNSTFDVWQRSEYKFVYDYAPSE